MFSKRPRTTPKSKWPAVIVITVWSLLFGSIGYQQFQDSRQDNAATAAATNATAQNSANTKGGQRAGGTGKVIAVSNSSIRHLSHRSNQETTYNITPQTRITDRGEAKTYKDIKAGEVVLIWTRESPADADLIVINPNMDGSARP